MIYFVFDVEDVVDFSAHDVDKGRDDGIALEEDGAAVVGIAERQDGFYGPEGVVVSASPQ